VYLSAPLAVRGQLAASARARTPDPIYLVTRRDAAGMTHRIRMPTGRSPN
jgi:hypothetical protein